ncbi:MAG: ADP-ribose-binding protein, partial [bacterium]
MVKTQYGNLWKIQSDYKVVTTNGFVKKNGAAVMGRGVALQAKQKFSGLEFSVGEYIKTYGNHVGLISEETGIVIFPTKSVWWEVSDLRLIERSAKELKKLTEELQDKTF